MKKNFTGLDVLRGIGIFALLVMHTAFYHFEGLFELDLNDPPLIVTFIGLILMFAGVFAMISGLVHTHQHYRKVHKQKIPFSSAMKHNMFSGTLILIVAYLYFIFTGPGLADMSAKFMSNSILVELFTSGKLIGTTIERVLYVDSLVMIGMNIWLIGVFFRLHHRFYKKSRPVST
jgi:peptidoglycan/LPS O-acetylase OafA/YrhL